MRPVTTTFSAAKGRGASWSSSWKNVRDSMSTNPNVAAFATHV